VRGRSRSTLAPGRSTRPKLITIALDHGVDEHIPGKPARGFALIALNLVSAEEVGDRVAATSADVRAAVRDVAASALSVRDDQADDLAWRDALPTI
jgi:hypothetical protein